MAEVKSDRRQALELAIASIDRQFGKGAIMRLGQSGALDEIAVIPTGAMSLDVALGIGGIPRGRVTEIYGPESSGKTTLALHVIAEAQRLGGTAAFIDAEHALDLIYAKNLGVNTDELLISQPDTDDQATGTIEPRRVVNWFDNGRADQFLQFEVEGGPSGRRRFAATENHIIFTPRGPVRAGDLGVGSEVLVSVRDYVLTDDQWQVVLGGSLGDGSLRVAGTHTAHFRVGHGETQKDYLQWKHSMLAPFSGAIKPTGNGFGFDTLAMPALADLCAEYYRKDRSRIATGSVLDRLDARGLAVWYGDDGSFMGSFERWGKGKAVLYNKALPCESRDRVMATLERLGIGRPRDDGRGFWFSSEQTARL